MRHGIVAAVLMVLVVGLPRLASAEEKKPIVAVFGVEARGMKIKPDTLVSLTTYLASKLSESGTYEVIPQDKLKEALTAKKKESYKGCYQQSCQIEIGQELAADKALSTQVMKVGTKCVVTCNLYDLKKSTSGKAATAEGKCTEDGINASIKAAFTKMTSSRDSNLQSTPAAIASVGKLSEMVSVPAGKFWRGSPSIEGLDSEHPMRSIYLKRFQIGKNEVTVAQYRKCVDAGKCSDARVGDRSTCNWARGAQNHPMNCVNWFEAKAYCEWAGKRLPTDAEWEKAARGTDGRKYPWGNTTATCQRVVMMGEGKAGCGTGGTWPVGSKSPQGDSPFGVRDMAGNVAEWVSDWYYEKYYQPQNSPDRDPRGPAAGTLRGTRGGVFGGPPEMMRAMFRGGLAPSVRGVDIGFRCAKD